jgi:hypothetical protein
MSEGIKTKIKELDFEWVELIQDAIEIGLTIEEVREFFLKNKS